ncbi:S-adenosyl-L-methionine-dependent methyltransferase [Hymenopellis radicata]|nr:S-adenosyl-L-methionine-dependent methyltransferase [Hymenopellis radicata]
MSNQHIPEHGHDYVSANKEHYNRAASEYEDIPMILDLTEKYRYIVSEGYKFDPNSTTLLNFACGTGLIEKELLPHCKSIRGVDISQGMVDAYNKRAAALGASDKMKAFVHELKGVEGELGGEKFDVIICTAAYHHFESPVEITKILKFFLKEGGMLLVTDRVGGNPDETAPFPEKFGAIVAHQRSFGEEDMRKMFEAAGLKHFQFDLIPGAIMDGRVFGFENQSPLFLAKGSN